MSPRVFIVLGLLLALVLFISSEVAAADLAKTSSAEEKNVKEGNEVENAKYEGNYPGGGNYPGNGGNSPGNGGQFGGGRGRGGYSRRCPYRCCGRSRYYGRECQNCYC